ncbi:MAG: DUF3786 domain-containing protein [Desulfobacterales bacterium]|nr:DUF3786 domain-containing protein [Desulfobacterales bacterium]
MGDQQCILHETSIYVPPEYWKQLKAMDREKLVSNSKAMMLKEGNLVLQFLNHLLYINLDESRILYENNSQPLDNPLIELLTLVYLLNVTSDTVESTLIGVNELKTAHFFTGPHEFNIHELTRRYGYDLDGFKHAATQIGGIYTPMADVAFIFDVFPKIPIYYLLWLGDEEFQPRITLLFDKSIEKHLSADAIWGIVHIISEILLNPKIK